MNKEKKNKTIKVEQGAQQQKIVPKDSDYEEKKSIIDENIAFSVPKSSKNLKACLRCGLMKSHDQWVIDKSCPNCGPFRQLTLSNNVTSTNQHQGILSLIRPGESFLERLARLPSKSGLYSAAYGV